MEKTESGTGSNLRNLKGIFPFVLAILFSMILVSLFGCASEDSARTDSDGKIVIGTMPTEDILPMWVAEDEGLFAKAGLDVEIVSFDSAPALSAAITSGDVDMAMTDVMRAVKLTESGADVVCEWVTLGTAPDQGRFGIMAGGDAPYSSLQELSDYLKDAEREDEFAVGVASNTVPEYVFDKLCEKAGIPSGGIPTVEIASLPDRFTLASTGQIAAGAFPNSMLVLGEARGMKVIADDTSGENISESVMVARSGFESEHADEILKLAQVWDEAAALVNADPQAYSPVLAANANLNEEIAENYPVQTYPLALSGGKIVHPDEVLVQDQIEWMQDKGYGAAGVVYDASTGIISKSN